MATERTAVIIEDNAIMQEYLQAICASLGVRVLGVAANAEDATALLHAQRPAYALVDVRLEGERTGVDVSNAVQDAMPDLKRIFITGSREPSVREAIAADHPNRVLTKPFQPELLREAFGLSDAG